ncbi:MAG: pitrilysin family protein [Prolixibacteraceae bacterium]|jgi:zinc protease|nr:pitrilysin family protein [Prolixibacteraceae bacterium]
MVNRKLAPGINNVYEIDYLLPEKWKLDNGIDIWGINAGSQELVKIDFMFDAGSWHQSRNLVAGMTNALMSQGTGKYSAQQIAEIFDFRGAYLQLSADQQFGNVTILTLNKYLPEILDVTADVIKNPTFPAKEVKTQLAKKKQHFTIENNKVKTIAQKKFSVVMFGDEHPYSNTNVVVDYETLTRDDLVCFHSERYTSDNCRIILAGCYDRQVKELLQKYFGDSNWSRNGEKVQNPEYIIKPSMQMAHFFEKTDALQSAIRIGRHLPNRAEPNFFGLNILITILGGYFGSRLMMNVREDKGYTYGIGAGIFTQPNAAYLNIITEVGVNVCGAALDEIYSEIDRLQNEPVPDEELDIVRNYLLGETLRSFDGIFAMSASLKTLIESSLDYSHYDSFVQAIRSVTPAELQLLAQKYLNREELYQVVAGRV